MEQEATAKSLSARSGARKLCVFFSCTQSVKSFLHSLERMSSQLVHVWLRIERAQAVMIFPSMAASFFVKVKMGYTRSMELDDCEGELHASMEFNLDAESTLEDFQFLKDDLGFSMQFFNDEDGLYLMQSCVGDLPEGEEPCEPEVLGMLMHQVVVHVEEGCEAVAHGSIDFFKAATADTEVICELRSGAKGALVVLLESVLRGRTAIVHVTIDQNRLFFTVSELPTRNCRRKIEICDSDWLVVRPNLNPRTFSYDASSFEMINLLARRDVEEQRTRLRFTQSGLMIFSARFPRDDFAFETVFTSRENL